MKTCKTCLIPKDTADFYPHKATADRLEPSCKGCTKERAINSHLNKMKDQVYAEDYNAKQRNKYRRLGHKKPNNQVLMVNNYRERWPEKSAAHTACLRLPKPFNGANKHHWSYNSEHYKDVIWLTAKEHGKAHRFIFYDPETKFYKRSDTSELLKTKEDHEAFIRFCIETKKD